MHPLLSEFSNVNLKLITIPDKVLTCPSLPSIKHALSTVISKATNSELSCHNSVTGLATMCLGGVKGYFYGSIVHCHECCTMTMCMPVAKTSECM